jgi:hypothetical protein
VGHDAEGNKATGAWTRRKEARSWAEKWARPNEQYFFLFNSNFRTDLILNQSKRCLPELKQFQIKY